MAKLTNPALAFHLHPAGVVSEGHTHGYCDEETMQYGLVRCACGEWTDPKREICAGCESRELEEQVNQFYCVVCKQPGKESRVFGGLCEECVENLQIPNLDLVEVQEPAANEDHVPF